VQNNEVVYAVKQDGMKINDSEIIKEKKGGKQHGIQSK
jgi:hypothetical protein